MKRRLALARLQLLDAELQLLDEPFAGLDPDGVALMQRAVQNWQAAGRAVVVCTHDVARAENLCQRHLHLGGRRLQAPAPGGLHG